jgi:hypothetical protein
LECGEVKGRGGRDMRHGQSQMRYRHISRSVRGGVWVDDSIADGESE